jgi:2,3-dihydroxy-2,3-dihydro-p-cumate dehydrogenase
VTKKLLSQVAILTGAARGLGVALVERFAADGASLLLADMNGESLPQVAAGARDAGAPDVAWIAQDLSREEGAAATVKMALERWGRIDVLVNNAGGGLIRPFLEHTPETLRETINRNLWTTIWCTRAVLPHMIERKYGRIVNIGADSVHTGLHSHAGYNAAKGGVNGLTTGLAFEFAKHGITVNCVSPGGIMTPEIQQMLDPTSEVYKKHRIVDIRTVIAQIPIGRLVEMREVAALAAFLTYEESKSITGQIYSVNGGQWMM